MTVTQLAALRLSGMHLFFLLLVAVSPAFGQPNCSALPTVRKAIEQGWAAYRAGDIGSAANEFKRALALCPSDPGALTGAGYAAMREGRLPAAQSFFGRAMSRSTLLRCGGWREWLRTGRRHTGKHVAFSERALRIVPNDSTALAYLTQLRGEISDDVFAARPRPAQTTIPGRTGRRVIEVRNAAGQWSPLWIKAVNLGAALPGKYPSEFPPNDGTYDRWIKLIADMGSNTVRVYTIHPPHFYAALRNWNLAHSDRPLWLIHGVWAEPPPGKRRKKYVIRLAAPSARDER